MIERLKEILYETTDKSDITINKDTVLLTDLKINSFDLVELVCRVEDEFDIEIPDRVLRTFITVGDVIDFIENQ